MFFNNRTVVPNKKNNEQLFDLGSQEEIKQSGKLKYYDEYQIKKSNEKGNINGMSHETFGKTSDKLNKVCIWRLSVRYKISLILITTSG